MNTSRLTDHLLLNADNRGWGATCVDSLVHVHFAKALKNHSRLYGGFGPVLSHIVTLIENTRRRIKAELCNACLCLSWLNVKFLRLVPVRTRLTYKVPNVCV